MAWFKSGGGKTPLEFTKTKIVTNTYKYDPLNFTEDYHNYDLLLFELYMYEAGTYYEVLTTPDMIDEIFDKSVSGSNHGIMFNRQGTNIYTTYTYVSNTQWTYNNCRAMMCSAVYGITCNKTITSTTIYQRGNISDSAVTITTTDNLFDYDLIIGSICDGAWDDTIVTSNYINLMNISTLSTTVGFLWTKYATTGGTMKLTANSMSSGNYFMVQGIKFI